MVMRAYSQLARKHVARKAGAISFGEDRIRDHAPIVRAAALPVNFFLTRHREYYSS